MSTDYSASICVGYRFSMDEALKPFEKETGEDRFHMEPRFDPLTGKEVRKEKVWDERVRVSHEWNGIRVMDYNEEDGEEEPTDTLVESTEDLLEKMGERLGFTVFVYGNDSSEVVFMPKRHPKDTSEGYEWGRMTTDGNLSWRAVAAMGKDLEALRQKLLTVGLKPKKAEVVLAAKVS